jgi:outer membrane protein OmpA-like peptidoglycan-associated protein
MLRHLTALRPLSLAIALASLACAAGAQEVRVYGSGESVDPADVARILSQGSAPAAKPKMRSLRVLDDEPAMASANSVAGGGGGAAYAAATPATAAAATAAAMAGGHTSEAPVQAGGYDAAPKAVSTAVNAATAALSLPVQFNFDSADILPAARPQLDALAEGIRRLGEDKRVVIEGHTDAAGSEAYNEQLSLRRAQAVKRYLVAVHHIDPARLKPMGLGKYAPLPGLDPMAGKNRRVQFRGG